MPLEFETADVFTATRFGGNPLALVHGAEALDDAMLQAIAREFNLSETVFALAPREAGQDAFLRIFTPFGELPFAGHPNVGAAVLLSRRMGREGTLRLGQAAGVVVAEVSGSEAEIEAPKKLALGNALDPEAVAACAGLAPGALHLNNHVPLVAGCGTPFALAEVEDAALLSAALPDVAAFGRSLTEVVGLLLHTPLGIGRRRARMFAPLAGIAEDPATGSANCALAGLLLELNGGSALALEVEQGMEMGRPSQLRLVARREADGAIRVRVGGGVVPVGRGVLDL
ncbi:PhzF family phenazine biosynthesis protein [Sabulicella glaciei]|uniref:PhzF family phenazine biosynthesis protein n=1 Tax=Sabulicella glaciei TaxID=2984948 RepID=A0ABT3NT28_9PROT|nr:PhzF family phenazine biosynthesis protein [Roseococcus sp. MDT2-1-1]MCW8085310.1 PhzF family phenazine biosynthesis protein [Roseococcus sp. MDT2-1-1]